MTTRSIVRAVAGLAAVAAVAAGAAAVSSSADSGSPAASGANAIPAGAPGGRPPFGPHAMGTPVTGADAAKAKAAALAKYPGRVERVDRAPNGDYVVHVIRANGTEVHVLLDSAFRVTAADPGGPPRGANGRPGPMMGGPPPGRGPRGAASGAPAVPGTPS